MNCLQFLLAGKGRGEKKKERKWQQLRKRTYGEAGSSFERDKEGSVPASVMLLFSPSRGGEFACLCLVYMGYELSFLVSKAPFVKIIYFHLVREHSADMLCVLWKENQI